MTTQNEKHVKLLENVLIKCNKGKKYLYEILGSQRINFNKGGIGHNPSKRKKVEVCALGQLYDNFIKGKSIHTNDHASHASYTSYANFDVSYVLKKNCHGKFYAIFVGMNKKGTNIKKSIWVPKSLATNLKGPKQVLVFKNIV